MARVRGGGGGGGGGVSAWEMPSEPSCVEIYRTLSSIPRFRCLGGYREVAAQPAEW